MPLLLLGSPPVPGAEEVTSRSTSPLAISLTGTTSNSITVRLDYRLLRSLYLTDGSLLHLEGATEYTTVRSDIIYTPSLN